MKYIKPLLLVCLMAFTITVSGQYNKGKWLIPADSLHKGRFIGVNIGAGVFYTGALTGLSLLWYKNYPRSNFHFFDDSREWMQVDKAGHFQTAYFEGVWATEVYKWTGLEDRKAIWLGGMMGSVFQTTIEILDGYSEEWGASWSDLGANTLGSAMVISQNLLWNEQRILVKISSKQPDYPNGQLQMRADDLYGTAPQETFFKDYNGMTIWLSGNPASFMQKTPKNFPKWLNIAVGYGANNMYGGFENTWTNDDGTIVNRNDIERYRQFYLSFDVDLTRIPTHRKGLKVLLGVLNIIKIPSPTLEFNKKDKVKAHWLYF